MKARSIQHIPKALALLAMLAFFGAYVAHAGADARVPGHYIVILKDSVDHPGAVARNQVEQRDGELGFVYRTAIKGYSAALSKVDVEALRQNSNVAYIEPDVRGEEASQTSPTGIKRVFAAGNKELDIDEADDRRVNVDVAVIDGGIDDEHPDLDVVSEVDCSGGPCEAGGESGTGHGTHVAGTIAAIDNGFGVVGVAPGARLWSVKVLDNEGQGELSEYIAGLDWVTEEADKIEVANSSLGYPTTSSKAFEESFEASIAAGVVHVVAAGNSSEAVKYVPANHPKAITVSAIYDSDGLPGGLGGPGDDARAFFSNFGSAVDITAPGLSILSTEPGGEYGLRSGTSMAAPHVAGALADMISTTNNPANATDVANLGNVALVKGNSNWTDNSGDGVKEPLLDVSSELIFRAGLPPHVETKNALGDNETAVLKGFVNANDLATTFYFEYGLTEAYGSKSATGELTEKSWTEIEKEITGLSSETTYHYRLVATSQAGTTYGEDATFTSSPLGFISSEYPVVLGGVPKGEFFSSGMLYVGSNGYSCEPPVFEATLNEANRALTTTSVTNGDCPTGSQKLDLNGCQFTFSLDESALEGPVTMGPSECGPITVDYYPAPQCEFQIDPHNNFEADAVYEPDEEGQEIGINMEASFDYKVKEGGCGTGGATLQGAWQFEWKMNLLEGSDIGIGPLVP